MTTGAPASGIVTLRAGIGVRPRCVALVGNPNVGKSSLFNVLTGLRQKVANYPGITVERHVGTLSSPAGPVKVVDLPGAYSLLPRSPDEGVVRDEILGRLQGKEQPDVIVVVADAVSLERSLFLVSQVIETGRPVVLALNQWDVALMEGVQVDTTALAAELGVPVVVTCGRTGSGRDPLVSAILKGGGRGRDLALELPAEVDVAAKALADSDEDVARLRVALCSAGGAEAWLEDLDARGDEASRRAADAFRRARKGLRDAGVDVDIAVAEARYRAVGALTEQVVRRTGETSPWQARLDRFFTHPVAGTLALLAIFAVIFLAVFSWSGPAISLVDGAVGTFGNWFGGLFGTGLFADFVANGFVAGLGAFLVFVPQIAVLFIGIEALEDSGYLARAAFLLDQVMGKAGLPGRAFLPLLSGFACAIPGIMATRTIESRRDRFVTMAVLPLMSCQARLPVYAVVVGALFTAFGGWVPALVVLSMYLVGILTAFVGARFLRKTVLRGGVSPLLLELPPYRRPSIRTVLRNTARRTWSFVAGAGPIILALTMVLWVMLTFPRDVTYSRDFDAEVAVLEERAAAEPQQSAVLLEQRDALNGMRAAERLSHTYGGRAGRLIEPALKPLGFDWKIGVAIIGSFAAREVFVPTLGVIYAVGDKAGEDDPGLLAKIRNDRWPDGRRVFTPLVGISLLIFYVLALQCMSTLAVIKRETNSWRWPLGVFAAHTGLAYLASLLVFQVGTALGF